MAQRRFGPTRGAGVVIIEKESQPTIQPAALGSTAYTGILQKGPVGKIFRTANRTDFLLRAGSFIPESLYPDAAFNFFSLGKGAGSLWNNRVTAGNEKKSSLPMTGRKDLRAIRATFSAGNGGRWGGKKAIIVDEYGAVTATTLQLGVVPADLENDELVGAQVSFDAIPGKSFKVEASTAAGLLTFAIDVDLVLELGGSPNQLIQVKLENEGLAIAVQITEGTDKPTTEWKAEIFLVEGNIATLTKTFDNLSSDPTAGNYYVNVINDDSDSDFLVTVEDNHLGSIDQNIRPANYAGVSDLLTPTTLKARIADAFAAGAAGSALAARAGSILAGATVIRDQIVLTNSAAGIRADEIFTQGGQPSDDDTIEVAGVTLTFKTVLTSPAVAEEILIGSDAEGSLDNALAVINANSLTPGNALYNKVFAEKDSEFILHIHAQTAGVAGNALTTVSSFANWVAGAGTLSSGTAEEWSVVSANMSFATFGTLTSGVAFAAVNQFGMGFTLIDMTRDSTKVYADGDTITIEIRPLEVGKLVGGLLFPDVGDFRDRFEIVGNTAELITVKNGSDMTLTADLRDTFRVSYLQEMSSGYDGIADIADIDFLNAYDSGTSPLKGLRGQNLGLVKLGTPGVTATAIQKAGVSFGEGQNWQYRYEIPANIVSEQAAEEFINDTIGRNDFGVVFFPSFGKVTNPLGEGLKLISMTGAIHGAEAKVAKDFDGFHKAAAGLDVKLTNMLARPDGLEGKTLDEEFLNPIGIGVIKKLGGNFVLWGDRTAGIDPAFKFKHQRETLSHYENTFLENFDFIIFALNNSETQEQLKSTFIAFFTPEFAKGAIVGSSLADAVVIKIDDENNTLITRAAGDLNAEIGVRIVDTVERFIITISKLGITETT